MGYITSGGAVPSYVAPGYTEAQLVDKVKIRMDEIDHNAVITVGTVDNYPITTMITNILNECKTDVLMNAPMALLPKAKIIATNTGTDVVVTERPEIDAAEIEMPDDTLRIAAFHNEFWRKPVTKIHPADSLVLSRQNYQYTRATAKTPAVVLVDGTTYLAFPYSPHIIETEAVSDDDSGDDSSSDSGDTPAEPEYGYGDFTIYYVSSCARYEDLSDKAIEALCWDCAAKVFAAMGMTENFNRCNELYQAALK